MKERKTLLQKRKNELSTKAKVLIINFLDKGKVDIMNFWE